MRAKFLIQIRSNWWYDLRGNKFPRLHNKLKRLKVLTRQKWRFYCLFFGFLWNYVQYSTVSVYTYFAPTIWQITKTRLHIFNISISSHNWATSIQIMYMYTLYFWKWHLHNEINSIVRCTVRNLRIFAQFTFI